MQCIYKITNQINGKFYIGQTIDVRQRFSVHRFDGTNQNKETYNYPLYRAMRKYGLENFEFAVLEVIKDRDKLTERETFWYEQLKPEYNQVEPTNKRTSRNKPMYMIDPKTLKIVKKFDGFRDAQRYFGASCSTISEAANGKRRMARKHYWVFVKDYTLDWKPPRKTNYNIIATNVTTGETRTYQTALAAAKGTGSDSRRIGDVVLGRKNTTHGWTFTKEPHNGKTA
jgi:hypothetical protein